MWHISFALRAHHVHAQYFLKGVEEPIAQLLQEATYYYSRIISSGLFSKNSMVCITEAMMINVNNIKAYYIIIYQSGSGCITDVAC